VLHPDLDVVVVVMDRLEAYPPDDFKGFFIGELQREDQVVRVGFYELPGRAIAMIFPFEMIATVSARSSASSM